MLRNLGDEGIGIRGGGVDWFTGRVVGEMGDGEEMGRAGEGKGGKFRGEEDWKREDKGEMLTTGETESEIGLTLSMARLKLLA